MTTIPRRTFYVRFKGSSTGFAITATGKQRARQAFCQIEGVSILSSYVTVCTTPTPGVVYTPLAFNHTPTEVTP